MRKNNSFLYPVFAIGVVLLSPAIAHAQAAYVGDLFNNMHDQWGTFGVVFTALCEIMAGFLVVNATHNVVTHATSNQKPLREGLFKYAGAGLIGGLPVVVDSLLSSLYGGIPGAPNHHTYFNDSGIPTSSLSTGTGLDTVITNLMANIYGPTKWAIQAITYIGGVAALFKAGWNVSQSGNGQQPAPPAQTAGLALGGAILVTLGQFSDMLTTSMFGGPQTTQFNALAYTISGMDMTHVNAVYKALFAFVEVNGFIAVARAAFMAQQIGSGKSQKTYGQAAIFFVAGVIAINMAPFVKIVGNTIGVPLVTTI